MSGTLEETIGKALAAARQSGAVADAPEGWPPSGTGQAEAIQAAATREMGEPVAGWKIGATSTEAQRIMGCDGPFCGPLFASRIFEDGATIPFMPGTLGVECEYAFRIAADQPAGKSDYDAQSIVSLVGSCHPALEIIGRRFAADGFPSVEEAVADFAANVAFVHGPSIENWQQADLAGQEVRGLVDGRQTNAGFGSAVRGHPLNALAWLANALAGRGTGLRSGNWVSTGTCLGVVPVSAGAAVTGEYGSLGRVGLRFGA